MDAPRLPPEEVTGTWAPRCFQLFLGDRPALFDMLAFLCAPQIGVYGEDYTPCGPIGFISLPPSLRLWEGAIPLAAREELARVGFVPVPTEAGDTLGNLAVYINIHTMPPQLPCQKLICSNTDEFNLMYHYWTFRDKPYAPEPVLKQELFVGVFEPQGIASVHEELEDGGTTFGTLSSRFCIIHECQLSPANLNIQLAPGPSGVCAFLSVATHPARGDAVVVCHILPGSVEGEASLQAAIDEAGTLRQLFGGLRARGLAHAADAMSALLVDFVDE